MNTKQNVNEPLPASDLFGLLRRFLERHRADEREWDAIDALQDEMTAYRSGGVTEEILRRNDGYIKVGRGCAITLANAEPNSTDHLTN